jgi:hypothetical protein
VIHFLATFFYDLLKLFATGYSDVPRDLIAAKNTILMVRGWCPDPMIDDQRAAPII